MTSFFGKKKVILGAAAALAAVLFVLVLLLRIRGNDAGGDNGLKQAAGTELAGVRPGDAGTGGAGEAGTGGGEAYGAGTGGAGSAPDGVLGGASDGMSGSAASEGQQAGRNEAEGAYGGASGGSTGKGSQSGTGLPGTGKDHGTGTGGGGSGAGGKSGSSGQGTSGSGNQGSGNQGNGNHGNGNLVAGNQGSGNQGNGNNGAVGNFGANSGAGDSGTGGQSQGTGTDSVQGQQSGNSGGQGQGSGSSKGQGSGSSTSKPRQNSSVSTRDNGIQRYDLYVDRDGDGAYETKYLRLKKGTTRTIRSNAGTSFVRWSINSGNCAISNPSSKDTTVTMGESDAFVYAVRSGTQAPDYDVCSFCITCKPFYENSQQEIRDNLPAGGEILNPTAVEIKEGDSVYDVLKRVCADKGIQYTAQDTMYGIYISSIDNLSEKYYDGSAGWCYTVNGEYPSVSSSEVKVKQGDSIQWIYDVWTF